MHRRRSPLGAPRKGPRNLRKTPRTHPSELDGTHNNARMEGLNGRRRSRWRPCPPICPGSFRGFPLNRTRFPVLCAAALLSLAVSRQNPGCRRRCSIPATAGYRRRPAHDHHASRRTAARDLPRPRVATPGKPRPPPAGRNSEAGKATAVAPDPRPLVLGHPFPPLAA